MSIEAVVGRIDQIIDPSGNAADDFVTADSISAMLSAIEILPGLKDSQRPLRIVTRDVPYYSNDSRWWGPDTYFKGGQLSSSDDPALGADDPEMYETERWGHFSYAIPVTPGRYVATFHFIEHRFDDAAGGKKRLQLGHLLVQGRPHPVDVLRGRDAMVRLETDHHESRIRGSVGRIDR